MDFSSTKNLVAWKAPFFMLPAIWMVPTNLLSIGDVGSYCFAANYLVLKFMFNSIADWTRSSG